MNFIVKSLEQDVLCITVFDRDLFSPNGKVIHRKRCFSVIVHFFLFLLCIFYILFTLFLFVLDFLGRTEVSLARLLSKGKGPWFERLLLYEVETGEVVVRIELQLDAT